MVADRQGLGTRLGNGVARVSQIAQQHREKTF